MVVAVTNPTINIATEDNENFTHDTVMLSVVIMLFDPNQFSGQAVGNVNRLLLMVLC
jgi:hypothetical protein